MKKNGGKPRLRAWLWLRRLAGVLLGAVVVGLLVIFYANLTAIWASRGRLFDDAKALPKCAVGLVFGTSDRTTNGQENLYFRYRIDAAVRAWKARKLETLIVSGDNRSRFYNEPDKMKQALVDRGIPEARIICDYAGLRTLDSVVRAKEVFGVNRMMFISQEFQNERAIYLARANGIEAFGFNAQDVEVKGDLTRYREIGARVKMWLDVNFLKTRPQHLGERVDLPD